MGLSDISNKSVDRDRTGESMQVSASCGRNFVSFCEVFTPLVHIVHHKHGPTLEIILITTQPPNPFSPLKKSADCPRYFPATSPSPRHHRLHQRRLLIHHRPLHSSSPSWRPLVLLSSCYFSLLSSPPLKSLIAPAPTISNSPPRYQFRRRKSRSLPTRIPNRMSRSTILKSTSNPQKSASFRTSPKPTSLAMMESFPALFSASREIAKL